MTNVTNSSCTPSYYISFILSAKAACMSQLLVPQGSGVLGIFSYIRRLGQEKGIFLGYGDFVYIVWGSSQN